MGEMIAVWGSPGSGKTTVVLSLASALSERGTVSVLFCDGFCPALPAVFPKQKKYFSVGTALSAVEITEDEIMRSANLYENNGNMLFYGYAPGETVRSYPSFGGGRAADFLEKLSAVTDRTVIDCPSYLFSDPLSLAALRLSGGVVRLWSPDLRAPAYFQSVLKLLPEEKYRIGRHVRVLNLPDGEIPPPERETEAAMSGRESVFPHIKKLKCLFPEGGMLSAEARRLTKRPAEKILSFCDAGRDKK